MNWMVYYDPARGVKMKLDTFEKETSFIKINQ